MNNRIYKFRAWDKKKKEMIGFEERDYEDLDAWIAWSERYEIMQYTGLKGKNGEIYEGDVVRIEDNSAYPVSGYIIGFIEIREGKTWIVEGKESRRSIGKREEKMIKVLGNKFENKELL